jgi:hypothetical protein
MRFFGVAAAAVAAMAVAGSAKADIFQYTYTGYFTGDSTIAPTAGGSATTLASGGWAAFSLTGTFDSSTANEVAGVTGRPTDPGGIPTYGFMAYRSTDALLTFGGTTYTIDPSVDFSFAMFGPHSGFGPPTGASAAGFLISAITDGNGSISDFGSSSNAFSTLPVTTTFQSYTGSGQGPSATNPSSIFLDTSGIEYTLSLPIYARTVLYTAGGDQPGAFTAEVTDMPEPATMAVLGFGLAAMSALRRRRAV